MKVDERSAETPLIRTWLHALEFGARDYWGALSKDFLRRVYQRAAQKWLSIQMEEADVELPQVHSHLEALTAYAQVGYAKGLIQDPDDLGYQQLPEGPVEVFVHRCAYKAVCQSLLDGGLTTTELTCPRLGCLVGSFEVFGLPQADYELLEFQPRGYCRGHIQTTQGTGP